MLDLMEELESGARAARERDRAKFLRGSLEVQCGIGTIDHHSATPLYGAYTCKPCVTRFLKLFGNDRCGVYFN